MRVPTLVAGALLLALATPLASASSSSLSLSAPAQSVASGTSVPITVTLTLEDFLCQQPRTFLVQLEVRGDGTASGSLAPATVGYMVPAESYFLDPYVGTAETNLTVAGTGTIEILATFTPPEGACFAPGGFPAAHATYTVTVTGGAPTTAPPVSEPAPVAPSPAEPHAAPPAPATPSNGTTTAPPAANQTEPNATAPTPPPTASPAAPTPAPEESTGEDFACAPDTSCGYIGDFDAGSPRESTTGNNDVPSPSLLAGAAILGLAALLWRKR